ncbi:MAG: Fur family transcriptional regulator [bacterium]
MEQEKDFKKILKDAGLKSTIPRLAILKILSELKNPMTAQEIHKKTKGVDLVTLYRTLASFEEKQLVKKVNLQKDSVYYELNIDHHHHIVCTDCGTMEDFELCDMDRLTKKIVAKASNFKNIKEHVLELFGICNACAKI